MKVYLACSFAYEDKKLTESRKSVMQEVQKYIENIGYDVYNPARLKIDNAWDYSMSEWGNMVFEEDLQNLKFSDIVVFISYGKENNAGATWELGYAYANKKKIIIVSMDKNSSESLMCIHSATACLDGIAGLKNYDMLELPAINELNVKES